MIAVVSQASEGQHITTRSAGERTHIECPLSCPPSRLQEFFFEKLITQWQEVGEEVEGSIPNQCKLILPPSPWEYRAWSQIRAIVQSCTPMSRTSTWFAGGIFEMKSIVP